MDRRLIADGLRRALSGAVGLPAGDIAAVAVLIDVGEWRVAFETLCTQIYEYDLEVSESQRSLLRLLADALGVPVNYLLGDQGPVLGDG